MARPGPRGGAAGGGAEPRTTETGPRAATVSRTGGNEIGRAHV